MTVPNDLVATVVPIAVGARPAAPGRRPRVELTGGLLGDRQRVNREVTILRGHEELERAGTLDNFRIAAGRLEGERRGMVFSDSDVYKWLEALAWELGRGESRGARPARRRDDRARRGRAGAGRLPQHLVHGQRPGLALDRPRAGARALLRGASDPGSRRVRAVDGGHAPARRRATLRRPDRPRVLERRADGHRRTSRDRAGPGRARRGSRAKSAISTLADTLVEPPRPAPVHDAASTSGTTRMRSRCAARARSSGTRCARCTSRAASRDVYAETGDDGTSRRDARAVGRPCVEQDLSDGRRRRAPRGRVDRRLVRAAARPRVLRDVRRDREHHVELADAARHRRRASRRPARAHALQRLPRRPLARRAHVLLRQPVAVARRARPRTCGIPSRAARRTSCGRSRRCTITSRPRRTTACRSTSTPRRRSDAGDVVLRVETDYPWDGTVTIEVVESPDDRLDTRAADPGVGARGDARRRSRHGGRLRRGETPLAGGRPDRAPTRRLASADRAEPAHRRGSWLPRDRARARSSTASSRPTTRARSRRRPDRGRRPGRRQRACRGPARCPERRRGGQPGRARRLASARVPRPARARPRTVQLPRSSSPSRTSPGATAAPARCASGCPRPT